MGSSAFFLLFFITSNWFLVTFLFLFLTSIFFLSVCVQFYWSLSFFSLDFFCSPRNIKTNPKRTTGAAPVKMLQVSLAFGHLKHLNSGLCLGALSGYSHELSPDVSSPAGSTGVTGQDCKGPCGTEMQTCFSPYTGGRDLPYLFAVISSRSMEVLLFASPLHSLIFYLLAGEIFIMMFIF